MAEVLAPRGLRTATVTCPRCGGRRELSVRQRRRVVNGDGDFTCLTCRALERRQDDYLIVEQKYRDYWLERYSVEWITETARGIWGSGNSS